MAFFQLTLKAKKLEKMRLLYEDEKMRSIEVSKGAKIHYTLFQKIRHKKMLLKMRFKKWLKKVTSCPEDSWFHEKAVLLRTDGTFENYILKSAVGFCGGIFLTYLFFMFFVFQLNFTLSSATLLCSFFGIILTIGLAFSYRVRCVVFLLLPQFFSKRGRQALMAYAFILALTGPAKNTLHNMGVLSESLACGQEQLKAAVRAIVDLIKQPFYALRDSIAKVMKSIRVVVKKIKEALLAIKRIVLSILKVFKAVFQWLGSIMNICNKKLGTPFDRCQKVFEGAVVDCKASLGPLFGGICNLVYLVSTLCWVVKPFDLICMVISFITDSIVGVVKKKIKKFAKHVKAMFYVKVKFSHSFHFETNQSKSLEEVATGIVTEIRSRTDKFLTVFDWMSFATSFFFLFMILRVIHYRHKWLTSERFDNLYLTNDLREIDLRRARLDKETVLPLNPRERNKYIPLTSITLIKAEKIKLTRSAVFLWLTTFKLAIHMMADYSLYWMLSTIRYHGRFESKVETPNSVGVYVSGSGFLADLYRSIVRAFSPLAAEIDMDTMPCLPDPIPPDLDRYTQIVSLIFFCWIMAIFEPYGLRLRHVVMCYYHPDRAKQRAVWLYNHIIRSRGSFLKFARRQLRRKFSKSEKKEMMEKVTLKERLVAFCPIFRYCFGADKPMCLLCGAVERDNQPPLIQCPKPGCPGLFCIQCFSDLQNLCTICLEPIDYGDLSDISEERDSSDGQVPLPCGQKLKDKLREEALKKEETSVGEKELEEEEEAEEEEVEVGEEDEEEQEEEAEEEECDDEEEDDDDDEDANDDNDEGDDKKGSVVKTAEDEDELDESESCSSSSTVYSYSYQDESPGEIDVTRQRIPYKDVEAQKIRDDVTIQVFNDPSTEEESQVSEDLDDQRPRRRQEQKKRDHRNFAQRKSTESPYDTQTTSSASVADTESLPTEEIDEEEIIQEEVSEGYEEEQLLSKKRKKRGKKRNHVRKIVAILSKPFLKKGYERRCPGRCIQKKKSSLFDKIVNMVQTKPQECPRAAYRRLRLTELGAKPRTLLESSSTEAEEVGEIIESSPKSKLPSSHDLVELLSPRKYAPMSSGTNLPDIDRMQEIQHLEDSISSGEDLYSKNYDSHRASRKKLHRKTRKKCKTREKEETTAKYPHEKEFQIKQLPRYLKPVIDHTKYNEINEREIYETPRSDKEKDNMNKLSDTRTTSSASSVHNMWNIRSGGEGYNDCVCSRDPSLSSFDVPQSPINKYELDMSTIEEKSDEFSPRAQFEEESSRTETADEIVDVTGVSSTKSGVNLNRETEYKEKRSIKRLVTPDEDSSDEEMRPSTWESKKSRQEVNAPTFEEKVQNVVESSKPLITGNIARSNAKSPDVKRGEIIALAGSSRIVEEQTEEITSRDEGETKLHQKRKRGKRIDRSHEPPGEKRRKKRVAEALGEGEKRRKPPKLCDPLAGMELIDVRSELRTKKPREVWKFEKQLAEVEEKQYEVENKVESENKKEKAKGSREITKKEKFGNILKVFDFTGEKIGTENDAVSKLKEDGKNPPPPKTTARKIQTDFTNFGQKLKKSRIASPERLEADTSTTETSTDTEELEELINTEEFTNDYEHTGPKGARTINARHAAPQRHRKSPRKYGKRRPPTRQSYYTDPEDSPRRRGLDSYRSTFSDDEMSPRKTFASEHKRLILRDGQEGRDYNQEGVPRPRDHRGEIFERSRRQEEKGPRIYRDSIFPDHMEERDYWAGNRVPGPGPGLPNRDPRYRGRDYYSAERSEGQFLPDYRRNRCPASGDNASDRYDGRYIRGFSPEINFRAYDGGYQDVDRRRGRRISDERYQFPSRTFSPEDGRRQRVRDMFEMDYRRGYLPREIEPRAPYDPQRSAYDYGHYYENYDHGPNYGAEPASEIPMYNPAYPVHRDTRNFSAESTTIRYPQRYPSPRTYPGGIDPYYGISSPTPNPYIPCNQLQHEQTLRHSPAELRTQRPYPDGVDQYCGLPSPPQNNYVPYDQLYNQPVPRPTLKIPPKPIEDNSRRSFISAPILRKFLPIFQKPELIMELKEHDRIRLIQAREAKERAHESIQTTRIDMPPPTIQSEQSGDSNKVEATRPSNTAEEPRENSENRLPYQETEAFKEVVNEYEQCRSSKQQKRRLNDQGSLTVATQQADASTDITELYPPKGRRTDTMSRIASSFINAFSSKKQNKSKKSSSQRIDEPLLGSSQWVKSCQNPKCTTKVRDVRQERKLVDYDPVDMSSDELNNSRRKNRRGHSGTSEEYEADTTDNNETSREKIRVIIMPNLVERRKMRKQQFLTTPSQIYNIYYTQSVPVQQLPGVGQNLAQSFPQISLAPSSISSTRRTPRSSGLFCRNRNTPRKVKLVDNLPYFPEEYHRRQIANFAMNQLKIEAPDQVYQTKNYQPENGQHQNPTVEYQENVLINYEKPIDLPCSNTEERYRQLQGCQSDLRNMSMSHNSPQGSPTSVNSNLDPRNRGILNNSGQIITVPTQPMSSSQGYSMKIEVLAQPLKSELKDPENPGGDSADAYRVEKYVREKSNVDNPQNVTRIAKSKYLLPVRRVSVQSTKSIPCMKKNKKISFLTNIVRRIRGENSRPSESVCQTEQTCSWNGRNLSPQVFSDVAKTPLSSDSGHQTSEGISTCEAKDSNKSLIAQEILSPRQMISSMTNMCSAVKRDAPNTSIADDKTIAFTNNEVSLRNEEIVSIMPSFQDVVAKLEDTVASFRFKSDAERELFASVMMNQFKQHGIKVNISDQCVAEMEENDRKNEPNRKSTTIIEELSDKKTVDFANTRIPLHVHVPQKYSNRNLPEAQDLTSRSQVSQNNEAMNQFQNQIFTSSSNTNCKSADSLASYICESCRSRNPSSLLGQDENCSPLERDSSKKNINVIKHLDDGIYNWNASYEHGIVRNSYLMFEANPDDIFRAQEYDQMKYQRWLEVHGRDRRSSCQECADGGTSSRNRRRTDFTENHENFGHQNSLSHGHRQREHSPPERDLSSRLLHESNGGCHSLVNPSVSGFDHVHFDPDAEARRYPPAANLACCGLVMYGQNESALSLAQGHCCHRTIPVCGTVSEGVSPRYEPDLRPPFRHERDPCYLKCNRHREKTQICNRHAHRTGEKRRRHRHYHNSKFKGEKEKEEEEERDESDASPNGTIDAVLSPPPMLRNLAKAANTVLTTIFGRSAVRPVAC